MIGSVLRVRNNHLAVLSAEDDEWLIDLFSVRNFYRARLPRIMFGGNVRLLGITEKLVVLSYTTLLGTRYITVDASVDEVISDVNPDRGEIVVSDRSHQLVSLVAVRNGQLIINVGNQVINLGTWFILSREERLIDPVRRCPVSSFELRFLGVGYFTVSPRGGNSTLVFRMNGVSVRAVYFDSGVYVETVAISEFGDYLFIAHDGQLHLFKVGIGTVAVIDYFKVSKGWVLSSDRILIITNDGELLQVNLVDSSVYLLEENVAEVDVVGGEISTIYRNGWDKCP